MKSISGSRNGTRGFFRPIRFLQGEFGKAEGFQPDTGIPVGIISFART